MMAIHQSIVRTRNTIHSCFDTRLNTLITLSWLIVLVFLFVPMVRWSIIDSVWSGSITECTPRGACWVYVRENARHLLYGLYPADQSWRVDALVIAISAQLLILWQVRLPVIRLAVWALLVIGMPVISYFISYGGLFGLTIVPAQYWGGLLFNLLFSALSISNAFVIGLLCALIRQKKWGIYSGLIKLYIDLIRGLPLVSLLFFATLVLPYFFFDAKQSVKIIRLYWIFTFFGAAYMAEAIRGGLESITSGQYEAAAVLGLSEYQAMMYIIMPQALEIAYPSIMNLVIALLKDSTLLSTVAVLDIVGMMQATSARVEWMPYAVEGYLMIGFIFWVLCYGLSRISDRVERQIKVFR
jgi:general L-amino acid transport system permease protein